MGERDSRPRHLVIIDDNITLLEALQCVLRPYGEVTALSNPADALELLHLEAPIDVLITDVDLCTDIDGLDICVAARERRPRLPIIVSTGNCSPRVRQFCASNDIPLVHKGESPLRLRTLIRALLAPEPHAERGV